MELKELSDKWDKYAEAQEAHRKAVDERIAKLEKGESTADVEAKLAKANEAMTTLEKEVKELTLKSQRPAVSAEKAEAAEVELKAFNARGLAAAIEAGKSFAPLSADGYAQFKSALRKAIRYGAEKLNADEAKAVNVGTATQGGFLVDYQMESTIDRVVAQYSAIRGLARVIPIGSASYKKLVKTSGTSGATRGGETTAPTQGTSPGWVELEFKPGTYLSDQRITSEAIEDAIIDVENDLMTEMGIEFATMEGSDIVSGVGVNGPRGFQSYTSAANASYAWGSVGYIAGGHASLLNSSDSLLDLVHGLKRQYRANAAFVMNDATLGAIRKLKDGQGNYLWGMTKEAFMAGAVGTLLGYAVATDDFMPDIGANAYPVAFADWKQAYVIVDRKGLSVLRDPFSAVPYVKFVGRRRVGGGIANFEAIKQLKIATS